MLDRKEILAWIEKIKVKGHLSLGIDQGSSAVRYVLVDLDRREILRWGSYEVEGNQKDKEYHGLSAFFRNLAREIPPHKLRQINVNIQEPSVAIGRLQISAAGEEDRSNLIRLALRNQLSFRIEDAVYYCREYQAKDDSKDKICFNFVAADKTVLMHTAELVEDQFHTRPNVSIQGYAYESLIQMLGLSQGDETISLLNMGRGITSISIFHQGKLVFQRDIPLAGQDMTRSIMIMYRDRAGEGRILNLDEAEKLKRSFAIPVSQEGQERGDLSEEQNQKLFQSLQGVFAAWIQDVRLSFNFFYDHYDARKISKVYLCGGSANLRNFIPYLRQQLGMNISRLAFSEGASLKMKESSGSRTFRERFHEYAAALAHAIKPGEYANLSAGGSSVATYANFLAPVLRVGLTFFAAILLTWFLFLHVQAHYLKEVQTTLMGHHQFLKEIESPYLDMLKWKSFLQGVDAEKPYSSEILKVLSNRIPPSLILSLISIDRGQERLTLEGIVFGNPKDRAVRIADFTKSLKESDMLQEIEVPRLDPVSERTDEGVFRLTARLKRYQGAA